LRGNHRGRLHESFRRLKLAFGVEDNISTDEIMPAGARVLPFRSNIPAISRFVFSQIDEDYVQRTEAHGRKPSFVVAGSNYGQGSSREHAAIAPAHNRANRT
jgi:aconitate hydratase